MVLPTLANVAQVEGWVAAGVTVAKLPASLYGQVGSEDNSIFDQNPCKEMPGYYAVANACTFGDKKATPFVVLYGDSFAQMWIPALDQLGLAHHFRVIVFARYGCVVASVVIVSFIKTVDPGCVPYRQNVLSAIDAMKSAPQMVIFAEWSPGRWFTPTTASGHYLTATEWATGVKTTIRAVHNPSIVKVMLLGTSFASVNPSRCLSAHISNVTACNTTVSNAYLSGFEPREASTVTSAGAFPLRLNKFFCTASTCPDVAHSMLTHANEIHVNRYYSRALGPALGELLGCVGSRLTSLHRPIGSVLVQLGGAAIGAARINLCAVSGG